MVYSKSFTNKQIKAKMEMHSTKAEEIFLQQMKMYPVSYIEKKLDTHTDRKAKRAYTYTEEKKELTVDDLYQLCQQQQQKNNITQKILTEIQQFCIHKHQGHKYRNGMYFFPNKQTISIVAAPKKFWMRTNAMKKKIENNTTKRGKTDLETPKIYK